jgi:hypothetical protein
MPLSSYKKVTFNSAGGLSMKLHSLLSLVAAIALAVPGIAIAHEGPHPASSTTATLADTKAALRDLWIGHVFWVRNVVDARIEGNAAESKAAEAQVVSNARAIADSIEPYYGQAAADKLFGMLAGHWGAISDYLDATRDSNKSGQDVALKSLLANADQIAVFLSGANPNLSVDAPMRLRAGLPSNFRTNSAKHHSAPARDTSVTRGS